MDVVEKKKQVFLESLNITKYMVVGLLKGRNYLICYFNVRVVLINMLDKNFGRCFGG